MGVGRPLTALQVVVQSRNNEAPGSTEHPLYTAHEAQSLSDANAQQLRLVNAAKVTPWPGSGLCGAWVHDVYANAGFGRYYGNACNLYDDYCTSSNLSDLKVGMIIAVRTHPHTTAGSIWGHVGMYIGDDKVMQSVGTGVTTESLKSWMDYYGATCTPKWGWNGNARAA